jgi:ketosteroid isomerase-like protein
MDANANARVIHSLYQAYITGEVTAFDCYTDDSQWVEIGENKRSGVHRGRQEILEHAMQLAVLTDGTIATKVKEILPGDEYVAVIERATATRLGRALDMDCCSVYAMRDGKIAELHVLPFDAAEWNEFWS